MLHTRMKTFKMLPTVNALKYVYSFRFQFVDTCFLHGVSGKEGNGFVPQIYKTDIFHDDTRGKARRSANSPTNNRDM